MSSPPTPTTSIKNVNLSNHKKRGHSSTFASIAALCIFRKKPAPDPPAPALVEPYEVAPGIWNTDATAKAFGYIDTDDEKRTTRSKTQSVKSKRRHQSVTPKRKPVPASATIVQVQEIHTTDIADDLSIRSPKTQEETQHLSGREQRDEAKKSGEKGQRRIRRSRMRTVDSDDRLTVRGANPRTGLVSPAIVSDNSDSSPAEDYVNIRKPPIARNRSGKWKAEGQAWSLVESPQLSPIPQSTPGQSSCQVSMKDLQDKLLLEMPGLDNPAPENMTVQRMMEYQEELARIHKEGSDVMVNPNTLPSPRAWTPEGPSTPPNRFQKLLRRKQVGSGFGPRNESTGTIVRDDQRRASSVPAPRKEGKERHQTRVRIVTPSNTPRDSSLESRTERKVRTSPENPFLGSQQPVSGQTANGTQSQYTRIGQREEVQRLGPQTMQQAAHSQTFPQMKPQEEIQHPTQREMQQQAHRPQFSRTKLQEEVHPHSHRENQSPSNRDLSNFKEPPVTLTLSQYLPRLHFLPPSHFANLEKSPSCRPAQTLPARLRPLDQQRKVTEDACISTSTFTTTSSGTPARERKPRIQRLGGSSNVPRANHRPSETKTSKENYVLAGLPTTKRPSCTKLTVETQDLRHGKTCHTGRTEQVIPQRDEAEARRRKKIPLDNMDSTEHQTKAAIQGAERAARLAVLGDTNNWPVPGPRLRKRSIPMPESGGLRLGSANFMRDNIQKRSYGDGCIPTYDHPGKNEDETFPKWGFVDSFEDQTVSPSAKSIAPAEYAVRSEGSAWFAGQWVESEQHDGQLSSLVGRDLKGLVRRSSISRTATSAKVFLYACEDWLHLTAKLSFIQHRLYEMARHVLRTFHHNSPALAVLRSPNARLQDYLIAAKDIVLAVIYLLVLLNAFMALRKLVMTAARIVYWVWHPVDLMAVALKWCVMT